MVSFLLEPWNGKLPVSISYYNQNNKYSFSLECKVKKILKYFTDARIHYIKVPINQVKEKYQQSSKI